MNKNCIQIYEFWIMLDYVELNVPQLEKIKE